MPTTATTTNEKKSPPARKATTAQHSATRRSAPGVLFQRSDIIDETPAQPEPAPEPAAASSEKPLIDAPADKTPRPTVHKGLKIVRETLIYNLPKAPFRTSRIHLEDGTIANACRDCIFTADTRGQVMEHRNQDHGTNFGRKNMRPVAAEKGTPDPILTPREDGTAIPSDPMDWTFRELISIAPSLTALGDKMDALEKENEWLREELDKSAHVSREDQHKIDVYDANRRELIDLRSFKRNITKRLEAVGFKLTETEEDE